LTKPKNRSIPQIPKAVTPGSPLPKAPPGVETKPASDLTKSALALLQQNYAAQAEAIAQQAAQLEGYKEQEGWKLDVSGVWFRPRPTGKK
jgi:hypothetical protein